MKKQLKIAILIFCLGICFNAFNAKAGFSGPEGMFTMNKQSLITIKEILQNHYDDMKVNVQGYIIKRLSPDKYLFKDETTEITVDIDEKYMPYDTITPKTLVRIYGEVEIKHKSGKIEIEAYRVETVKQQ